ncbi:MAG: citrate synthase [archaeon]|nr:citrate synthase [archaeon]
MSEYDTFISEQTEKCRQGSTFKPELYAHYDVKKGLRDQDGKGVVAGLTNISRVTGFHNVDGDLIPCEGSLQYRGYDIRDLIDSQGEDLGLFEKCTYLLLFNELPDAEQLTSFRRHLNSNLALPVNFVKDVIMRENGTDVMNTIARGVLNLALHEENLSDMCPENALRNSLNLIASMPALAAYGHQAYAHFSKGEGFYILHPDPELTIAENILRMLHPQGHYSRFEALVLDRLLVLHMEHGGGNNSAFTARVVSSAGSDTYSVIVAALMSLKGPKHGGANLKVSQMTRDIRENVANIDDRSEMEAYLSRIIDREVFDRKGLIYGMGHAVYTRSDPRAQVMRSLVDRLAVEKGREKELEMYHLIEELAPEVTRRRHKVADMCANVDLYSGFAYELLGIPDDLYTPMFAVARTVGWCSHHLEEILSSNRIIRPAYVSTVQAREL